MSRGIILVLDSFGIGASADANRYGDAGANTLGHIAEDCYRRQQPLNIPHLQALGLANAAVASAGKPILGLNPIPHPTGIYGYAAEISHGKDTPSGHWEMAGLPVLFDWGYFSANYPSFPQELTDAFIAQCNLPGILGNKHASGTVIIDEFGAEHMATGKPIVYTSADSVFQIACHEETFGLQRLYDICEIARKLVDKYRIGRVIARPFIGSPGNFKRTANRHDLVTPPHGATLLDRLIDANREVIAIGKIADIFANRGISQSIKADSNMTLFDATLGALALAPEGSLVFSNFVDFDSVYGHRRNIVGYAQALEAFDQRLTELQQQLKPGDLVLITADHGCDPSQPGSDHTREHIPIIGFGPGIAAKNIGKRDTFADIGQSMAQHLGIQPLDHGISFI